MQTISIAQLREKLATVKGATFVTISALTDTGARKTSIVELFKNKDGSITEIPTGSAGKNLFNSLPEKVKANKALRENPFEVVLKLNRMNATTGADYESSVNRQQGREGTAQTFEAQARKWGKRIAPALVEHNGKYYLPIQPRPSQSRKPVYFGLTKDGVLLQTKKDKIEQFLPPKYSQAEAQGVEKEIIYRDVALDSIVQISIGGEQFRVRREK